MTFLPYLQGERTPHRDASARGAFLGLSLAHTRAHLTRAVLEGICFALRDSLSILQDLGLSPNHLLLTGGGAKSAVHPAAAGRGVRRAGDDGEPRGRAGVRRGAARGGRRRCVPGSRGGGARDAHARRRSSVPDPQAHRDVRRAVRAIPRSRSCARTTGSASLMRSTLTADAPAPRALAIVRRLLASQETGLVDRAWSLADDHADRRSPARTRTGAPGEMVNNFWNSNTLVQTATDASFFAIMAIGATIVIISGGIDLSVGSIYALAGVTMALVLRAIGPMGERRDGVHRPRRLRRRRAAVRAAQRRARRRAARAPVHHHARHDVGAARHRVRRHEGREHPRAAVAHRAWRRRRSASAAGSIRCRCSSMIVLTVIGAIYLTRTVMGRHIFAFGGNLEASRFAGLSLGAHPDRRVRRVGAHRRASRRSSARASTARRRRATRRATSCT